MTESDKTDGSPARGRRPFPVQTVLVVALVAGGAVLAAREVRERLTFVHESDARITGELVTVSSRVDGWLTEMSAEEGQQIARDAVLAVVDARESALLVTQLEAQRGAAAAERERLAAERSLVDEVTRTAYDTRRSRLGTAEATLAALQPQLDLAISELARSESLFEKRVISRSQVDQARATTQRIEGEHLAALARQEEARAEMREAQADRGRLAVLDREVDKLRHREAELDGRIEQQRLDLADRTIRSPLSGVVDRTFVEVGEYVRAGQRLAIVHDPRTVWVEANVKETQVRKLAVGQSVSVSVDAYPDEGFEGAVESIGNATTASFALLPNPNPSGNFTKITQRLPVRIAIEQRGTRLRPGMMVEVRIDVRQR